MRPKHIAPVVAALLLAGCATFYSATCTLTSVVDSAMKQWASMSVAGKTTVETDAAVVYAHDKYRAACGVAQAALIAYKTTGDQAEYVRTLAAARTAASGLFDIILPLLTPDQSAALHKQFTKASSI